MLTIREAIVVEGRYDKNTLSQVVDTLILETNGFGIFKDPERMSLLRRAAERETLIIVEEALDTDFSWAGALGYEIEKSKEYKTNKHVFLRKN